MPLESTHLSSHTMQNEFEFQSTNRHCLLSSYLMQKDLNINAYPDLLREEKTNYLTLMEVEGSDSIIENLMQLLRFLQLLGIQINVCQLCLIRNIAFLLLRSHIPLLKSTFKRFFFLTEPILLRH